MDQSIKTEAVKRRAVKWLGNIFENDPPKVQEAADIMVALHNEIVYLENKLTCA